MSSLDMMRLQAKRLAKQKKLTDPSYQLKDALNRVAVIKGYVDWRELKQIMEVHERLYASPTRSHLNVWFARADEALEQAVIEDAYVMPYGKQFYTCLRSHIEGLGLDPDSGDVNAIGRDWSRPASPEAWVRVCRLLNLQVEAN